MPAIQIEAKVIGQKRSVFTDYELPLPPTAVPSGALTLRELIALLVREEVDSFQRRQADLRLAQVLSPQEIAQGAARGKILPGEIDREQAVDVEAAIATAWQAFEDGLYFVFLDKLQLEALDQTVTVKDRSHLLFVRLVALAGG